MKALNLLVELRENDRNIFGATPEQLKVYDEAIKELEALQSKFTRVEIISTDGRVFVDRCDNKRHYELSIQDDNRTLKVFEVKDKQ